METDLGYDISLACSFTGYRPSKMPFKWDKKSLEYKKLYSAVCDEITKLSENGVKYFLCGMARGADLMCGEAVLDLRNKREIELICVVPCINQYYGWGREDAETYKQLISNSFKVIQVTTDIYSEGCMIKRNHCLVENSQYLLAIFDGRRGGTMSTINFAKKQGRTIIIIDPEDLSITKLIHGNEEGVIYYV